MSVFNSISVGVLIVLLGAGLITGLSLSDADILNPNTSTAEATRMNVETSHQEALYEQQERLAETETTAQIRTIERAQDMADARAAYNINMLALYVRNKERSTATWLQIATWVGGALSISLVIVTFLWAGSKAIITILAVLAQARNNRPAPEQPSQDPWRSEEYRKVKIDAARQKERFEREEKLDKEKEQEEVQLDIRLQSISDPASTGKTKYNDLPLAG